MPSTGVVTVADATLIDFETAPGPSHTYSITVQATAGLTTIRRVYDRRVEVAPTTPTDSDGAANTVAEGAARLDRRHYRASTDVDGGAVTYSLTGDIPAAASPSMP